MQAAFEERGITTQYVAATDGTVHVGYQSHQTDSTKLAGEVRIVVATVLDHRPGVAVEGAVFHTDRPAIGTWRVEREWAEQYETGALTETALASKALHTLEVASFQ